VERQAPVDDKPPLPESSDAATTARWITQALDGRQPVPEPILEQVEQCLRVAREIRSRS